MFELGGMGWKEVGSKLRSTEWSWGYLRIGEDFWAQKWHLPVAAGGKMNERSERLKSRTPVGGYFKRWWSSWWSRAGESRSKVKGLRKVLETEPTTEKDWWTGRGRGNENRRFVKDDLDQTICRPSCPCHGMGSFLWLSLPITNSSGCLVAVFSFSK